MTDLIRIRLAIVLAGAALTSGIMMGQAAANPGHTSTVQAQKPTETAPALPISIADIKKALGEPITETGTVTAVDYDARVVVIRDEQGVDHALYVGEAVKRLPNVKVGDKIKATYYMSLASRILQPGEAPKALEQGLAPAGGPGDRPGGTATLQERWVVTVNAVNPTEQTVTVTGEKGRTFTFKLSDQAKLAQVKPGDRVEITFTAALLVSMEPAG